MKVQQFYAYVNELKYKEILPKEGAKEQEPQYCINANLLEIRQGRGKRHYHTAIIYITKEQFEQRVINKMDKILIKDSAQWLSTYYSIDCYDEEKLKTYDESQLKQNANGKTYARVHFYAYTIIMKQSDWELVEKADECCYIQCGKVKFYIPEHQIDDPVYCFFFDIETYNKLVDNNMQTIKMNCYLHKQKKWQKDIELQVAYDNASGKYFANLIIKGE